MSDKPALSPGLKFALDFGPLLLFLLTNAKWGIFAATGAFMVAVAAAIAVSYAVARHVPVIAIVSAAVVGVFGGLTLFLQDETFIKLKPTIVSAIFGALLLGGLAFGKSLLALVFDQAFDLDAEGWRKLTLRWGLFFFALAGLNEIVWRTQSTDFWVNFKVFGVLGLTLLFAVLQFPLLKRHAGPQSPLRQEE